jgi:hypothetical protein
MGNTVVAKTDDSFRHAAVLAAVPNYHARSIMHAHSLQHNLQGRNVGDEGQSTRHVAWVGLVPRQFSSGDRKVLMGISKRGNQHLRSHAGRRSHDRAGAMDEQTAGGEDCNTVLGGNLPWAMILRIVQGCATPFCYSGAQR